MNVGEGPGHAMPGQPRPDVRIINYVKRIIIIDELVMERLPKYGPRSCDQENGDTR